jgi:hypothetical protein
MPIDISGSAAISAIISVGGAVAVVLIKGWFDNRQIRSQRRYTDQELHEMSVTKFREVIIAELTATRQALKVAEQAERDCLKREMILERRVNNQDWSISQLCVEMKRLNPAFNAEACKPPSDKGTHKP